MAKSGSKGLVSKLYKFAPLYNFLCRKYSKIYGINCFRLFDPFKNVFRHNAKRSKKFKTDEFIALQSTIVEVSIS